MLVLVHMTELMGKQPDGSMSPANIDAITERQTHHIRPEKPSGHGRLTEIWVVRQRQVRNLSNANAVGVNNANATREGK